MNSKIRTLDELELLVRDLKRQGKKIGFTSGAFDVLHAGHVDSLYKAKELCDILIVGLNSDASIKKYKSPNRPINPQQQRLAVLSALEMVDYVFVFEETNNNSNIERIKPDIYIKAGDYTANKLSSAPIVEKYGGKTIVVPIIEDTSTTKIIQKIVEIEKLKDNKKIHEEIALQRTELVKAVFLDRDGTINKDISYLHEPEKFSFENNAIEGLKKLYDAGYRLIIITDQPGIGLGYYTKEDFFKVNSHILGLLAQHNIVIDKIYFCLHSMSENCECKKPKTALVKKAFEYYENNIDKENSYVIGDKTSDIQCGKNAGLKTILVKTGSGGKDNRHPNVTPDYVAQDLADAARIILST
ncbi:MAG: HAD-IIIA family hydrolase [Candidatus Aenigmarchaeota archaeon]|nr:HAD-IIIA family hydrolase [Candidatus Aenigmarchaeota archaeon]